MQHGRRLCLLPLSVRLWQPDRQRESRERAEREIDDNLYTPDASVTATEQLRAALERGAQAETCALVRQLAALQQVPASRTKINNMQYDMSLTIMSWCTDKLRGGGLRSNKGVVVKVAEATRFAA